ncbi:hypothetical protein ACOMHN_015149 [Nucella lapillus]
MLPRRLAQPGRDPGIVSDAQHVLHLRNLCLCLGFLLNEEKCDLTPSQTFSFLGMKFNTTTMLVSPAPKHRTTMWLRLQPGIAPTTYQPLAPDHHVATAPTGNRTHHLSTSSTGPPCGYGSNWESHPPLINL